MNAFSDFINQFLFSYKFWLVFLLVCGILLAQHFYVLINCLNTAATGKTKYVLITDCESPLGYKIAIKLCASKVFVIAGCSSEENAQKLEEDINFNGYAFHMDVTNEKHVENVYEQMKEHLQHIGLWGIIHTKRLYSIAPIDWETTNNLKDVFDTNFWSVVCITKRFLPWLKMMRGRVVFVTNSNESLVTYTSSNNMAIAAIESFSHSLKREMNEWKVSVHLVDIGIDIGNNENHINEMWKNNWQRVDEVTKEKYGNNFPDKCISKMLYYKRIDELEINTIVEKINHALLSSNPRYKYHSSTIRSYGYILLDMLPESIKHAIIRIINPMVIPLCFIPVPVPRKNKVKRY